MEFWVILLDPPAWVGLEQYIPSSAPCLTIIANSHVNRAWKCPQLKAGFSLLLIFPDPILYSTMKMFLFILSYIRKILRCILFNIFSYMERSAPVLSLPCWQKQHSLERTLNVKKFLEMLNIIGHFLLEFKSYGN